ncbi:MAG: insulinase family protein [Candidatus Latescibacteria bacterium]|nr:insulinase family protein [Candidatus Latescibacterota bacterium]
MKIFNMQVMIIMMLTMTLLSCAGRKSATTESQKISGSPILPYTLTTLDNGLNVLVKEVHSAPIVAVYLWCNTGSVNEVESMHGISHFYEHMFFKGTKKRGVGEIDRAIKSLGGYNNAFTSKEYTAYYVVLPSENFTLAFDVLLDAIRNSSFPEDEIQKELGVIKEEINRKEDNPTGKLYEEIFKVLFPGTPYAHPVLGTKDSISGITRDNFKNYLKSFYVPNNMTAVVVGDVKTKDVIAEIKKLTVDWKPDTEVENRMITFDIPKREGICGFTLEKDVNMSYVMLAFRTAGYYDQKENITLDVVSSVLGEGKSSRLYRRFVEDEQIASSVQAFIYPLKQSGLFVIFGTMDRHNVQAFKNGVLEEIDRLREKTVNPDELLKAKTMLKADYQFGNETNADIGQTLGHYITLGYLDNVAEYEQNIEAVTANDISFYASQSLNPESYAIGVINQRIPTDREVRGE